LSQLTKIVNLIIRLFKHPRQVHRFLGFCTSPEEAFSGSVQEHELGLLEEAVKRSNEIEGPILEVGTLFGFTTQLLAVWKDEKKQLITLDNFRWNPVGFNPITHQRFTERILTYLIKKCNVTLFPGSNTDFYENYTGPRPSLVFIDAGHSYEEVMLDINWAKSQGIPLISGHDYSESYPGVMRAVDESFDASRLRIDGTVWFFDETA
jgi:methyltransferase family protein